MPTGGFIGFAPGPRSSGNAGVGSTYLTSLVAVQNSVATAILLDSNVFATVNIRAVIYDASHSVLLASSAVLTSVVAGSNRFPLTASLTLTAGTTYYVGYIVDNSLQVGIQISGPASWWVNGGQSTGSPPNPLVGGSAQTNALMIALELDGPGAQGYGFGPLDTPSGVTLSASNTVATFAATANLGARSSFAPTRAYGKFYAEITLGGTLNSGVAVGLNAVDWGTTQGTGTNRAYTYMLLQTGTRLDGTNLGLSFASGDTIGIAYDALNGFVWFNKNNGSWFGASSTAGNPVTPAGGQAVPLTRWPLALAVATGATGTAASFTLKENAGTFLYTPPAGYAAWTAPASNVNTYWNPFDSNVTLSNNNLTATSTGLLSGVRGVDRAYTGKYYFEYTATTWTSSDWLGLSNIFYPTAGTSLPNTAYVYQTGQIRVNGAALVSLGTRANGDIIGIALDMTAKLIWFRVAPSGNWNASGTANPATGTGGLDLSPIAPAGIPLYPTIYLNGAGSVVTANFGDTAYSGAVPSGFTSGFPANASAPANVIATQAAVLAFGSAPSTAQLTQAAILEFAAPNPNAQLTQIAAEQWYVGVPDVQLTNIFVEQWAQVNAINTQAVLTQILLEEWTSVALAGGAVTGNGPMISVIM